MYILRIGAIVSSKHRAVNFIRIALWIPAIMARYTFYQWQPAKGCWSIIIVNYLVTACLNDDEGYQLQGWLVVVGLTPGLTTTVFGAS